MSATTEPAAAGPRDVDELAGGELFGEYVRAFSESSRDAGRMLRVAVQVGQVARYQALLVGALRDRKPVADEQWHGLCASVPWPRPLPAWDRAPIEQWRLDITPDATPDWPEKRLMGCHIGAGSPLAWPEEPTVRLRVGPWLRAGVVAACAALLGLCLPSYTELGFWVGVAVFLLAVTVAALP